MFFSCDFVLISTVDFVLKIFYKNYLKIVLCFF